MKSLTEFITEARESIYKNHRAILHFASIEALALYKWEFEGQISDGKYEDSRPQWHWEWIKNSILKMDGKEFYYGMPHRVKYTFTEYANYAFSNKRNEVWARRLIGYVGAAKHYQESDFNGKDSDRDRYIIDDAINELYDNDKLTYDEWAENLSEYRKGYLEDSKKFNEDVFESIREATKMKKEELLDVIKSVQKTLNTQGDE